MKQSFISCEMGPIIKICDKMGGGGFGNLTQNVTVGGGGGV